MEQQGLRKFGFFIRRDAEAQRSLFAPAKKNIHYWQTVRTEGRASADVIFYGIARAVQILAQEKLLAVIDKGPLKSVFEKMAAIEDREGLGPCAGFNPHHPDTPADYKALFDEWQNINQSTIAEVAREYGENELADLLLKDPDEYARRYEASERAYTHRQKQEGPR